MSAGRRGQSWSGRRGKKGKRSIIRSWNSGGDKTGKKAKHRDIPAFDEGMRQKTHGRGIYGHAIKRIRRRREPSKSVLHPTVRVVVAITVVIAVVSSRRIGVVLLASAGAKDATHDGANNHEDSNWDTDLEPITLRPFDRTGCDVTGGFAVVRVPGTIRRNGGSTLCAVVVVTCVVVGHVVRLVVPCLLLEGNDHDRRESKGRVVRERREEMRDCSEGCVFTGERGRHWKKGGCAGCLACCGWVSRSLPVSLASFNLFRYSSHRFG